MYCLHQSQYDTTLADLALKNKDIQACNQLISIDHENFSEAIRKYGFQLAKIQVCGVLN